MRVSIERADLSELLHRVERGEEVEITRNGVPVARLTAVGVPAPGKVFLRSAGVLRGQIVIAEDFEFTERELDELLSD